MTLTAFIENIKTNGSVTFNETIAIITDNYDYKATEFTNGLNEDAVVNTAGTNEGSCKIFAFALLNHLTQQQTLNLFGDYYHVDVLQFPEGTDHANIRNFVKYGWDGISYSDKALTLRTK
ncbi:MAG: HopJ type III effector protein [Methylococcales bacterium]|nr:HopJ type III effector protein [Methylococcales bacterium]